MSSRSFRTARWATLLASFALVASAVGVQAESDGAEVPVMAVEVSGLASGDTVTANQIDLTVVPVGYELSPEGVGKPPVDGQGHYHVVLDGALVNAFFTPEASFSLQNVAAGPHTVTVVPALNSHMGVMEGATAIEFDYQPDSPLPLIEAASEAAGEAAVAIVSPAAGESVSGDFDLVIDATAFELSSDLLGKGNIDGIGHWHAFVDEVGQPALLGMAGGDSLTISTAGLEAGPHTFFAVLVDNLHAPFDLPIVTKVEVEVGAADAATEPAASAVQVGLAMTEFALAPADIELQAGSVTFVGSNEGSIDHALAIEGEGISAATPDAFYPPGTIESFRLDLPPGTYTLFCPIPGHQAAGMEATVTVSG